jgi:hypothetical protein
MPTTPPPTPPPPATSRRHRHNPEVGIMQDLPSVDPFHRLDRPAPRRPAGVHPPGLDRPGPTSPPKTPPHPLLTWSWSVANGTTASCVAPGSKRLVDDGRAPNRGRLPEQPCGSALNPTRHLHTREVEAIGDRDGSQSECRLASVAVRERYANALLSDQVDAIVLGPVTRLRDLQADRDRGARLDGPKEGEVRWAPRTPLPPSRRPPTSPAR